MIRIEVFHVSESPVHTNKDRMIGHVPTLRLAIPHRPLGMDKVGSPPTEYSSPASTSMKRQRTPREHSRTPVRVQ